MIYVLNVTKCVFGTTNIACDLMTGFVCLIATLSLLMMSKGGEKCVHVS